MAIPDADVILGALRLEKIGANEKAVRAAIQHARKLATWPIDEPAAMFFAFACRPRAVPALQAFAIFIAREQLLSLDLELAATDDELRSLRAHVLTRAASEAEVLSWFAERLPAE